jgi:hypothetical protein
VENKSKESTEKTAPVEKAVDTKDSAPSPIDDTDNSSAESSSVEPEKVTSEAQESLEEVVTSVSDSKSESQPEPPANPPLESAVDTEIYPVIVKEEPPKPVSPKLPEVPTEKLVQELMNDTVAQTLEARQHREAVRYIL